MTYKKFIELVEKYGIYKVENKTNHLRVVLADDKHSTQALISKTKLKTLDTCFKDNEDFLDIYFEICMYLAWTKFEERGEIKRYKIRHLWLGQGKDTFLQRKIYPKNLECRNLELADIYYDIGSDENTDTCQTVFTETEVDSLVDELGISLDDFALEEVC